MLNISTQGTTHSGNQVFCSVFSLGDFDQGDLQIFGVLRESAVHVLQKTPPAGRSTASHSCATKIFAENRPPDKLTQAEKLCKLAWAVQDLGERNPGWQVT
jgi:hypothetical protein